MSTQNTHIVIQRSNPKNSRLGNYKQTLRLRLKGGECKNPVSGLQINELAALRNTAVLQIAGMEARYHPNVCFLPRQFHCVYRYYVSKK